MQGKLIFLEGFVLQASLILALGAQNIFILNSGLRRHRHLFVAGICSICDSILILLGVLGFASLFLQVPLLKTVLGLVGVVFLIYYGLLKIFEGRKGFRIEDVAVGRSSLKETFFLSLGFSLLNPHAYLDAFVLLGAYSAKFSTILDRLSFAFGASFFSLLWFYGLALVAASFNRLLHDPKAMRIISYLSGTILLFLAFKLGVDIIGWNITNLVD